MKKVKKIQKEYRENIKRRNKLMRELEKKNEKKQKKENLRHLFERLKYHRNDLGLLAENKENVGDEKERLEITALIDVVNAIIELGKEAKIIKK